MRHFWVIFNHFRDTFTKYFLTKIMITALKVRFSSVFIKRNSSHFLQPLTSKMNSIPSSINWVRYWEVQFVAFVSVVLSFGRADPLIVKTAFWLILASLPIDYEVFATHWFRLPLLLELRKWREGEETNLNISPENK